MCDTLSSLWENAQLKALYDIVLPTGVRPLVMSETREANVIVQNCQRDWIAPRVQCLSLAHFYPRADQIH